MKNPPDGYVLRRRSYWGEPYKDFKRRMYFECHAADFKTIRRILWRHYHPTSKNWVPGDESDPREVTWFEATKYFPPPGRHAPGIKPINLHGGFMSRPDDEKTCDRIAELHSAAMGRVCTELEAFRWVADNKVTPWDDIKPDEIPGQQCIGLLDMCKRNELIFRDLWSKLVTWQRHDEGRVGNQECAADRDVREEERWANELLKNANV